MDLSIVIRRTKENICNVLSCSGMSYDIMAYVLKDILEDVQQKAERNYRVQLEAERIRQEEERKKREEEERQKEMEAEKLEKQECITDAALEDPNQTALIGAAGRKQSAEEREETDSGKDDA